MRTIYTLQVYIGGKWQNRYESTNIVKVTKWANDIYYRRNYNLRVIESNLLFRKRKLRFKVEEMDDVVN